MSFMEPYVRHGDGGVDRSISKINYDQLEVVEDEDEDEHREEVQEMVEEEGHEIVHTDQDIVFTIHSNKDTRFNSTGGGNYTTTSVVRVKKEDRTLDNTVDEQQVYKEIEEPEDEEDLENMQIKEHQPDNKQQPAKRSTEVVAASGGGAEGSSSSSAQLEQILSELSHPDLAFFRSLMPDMESMTASQKAKFKMAVMGSITTILYPWGREMEKTLNYIFKT